MKKAMAGQHLQGLCCIAVEDCQSYKQQAAVHLLTGHCMSI